ncbi:hypothetical protein, partial [Kiloniella majae]|uniref:hypothetical protein n=1 Tax=Kiloniella majae TaxID=1938558 RepID=UPI003B84B34D
SYLRVSDNDNVALLAIIENFSIVADEYGGEPNYVIDASPIGLVKGDKFYRGGDSLALPPKKVEPARLEDIKTIYESRVSESERFTF